jgi:hypothetical protein
MRIRSRLLAASAASAVVAASGTTLAGPTSASSIQDARSPDAIDAAATQTDREQDKRSPDATDSATSAGPPAQASIAATPPQSTPEASSGLDWSSAAIGAGGAVGLVAVATGAGLALHRRHVASPSRLAAP